MLHAARIIMSSQCSSSSSLYTDKLDQHQNDYNALCSSHRPSTSVRPNYCSADKNFKSSAPTQNNISSSSGCRCNISNSTGAVAAVVHRAELGNRSSPVAANSMPSGVRRAAVSDDCYCETGLGAPLRHCSGPLPVAGCPATASQWSRSVERPHRTAITTSTSTANDCLPRDMMLATANQHHRRLNPGGATDRCARDSTGTTDTSSRTRSGVMSRDPRLSRTDNEVDYYSHYRGKYPHVENGYSSSSTTGYSCSTMDTGRCKPVNGYQHGLASAARPVVYHYPAPPDAATVSQPTRIYLTPATPTSPFRAVEPFSRQSATDQWTSVRRESSSDDSGFNERLSGVVDQPEWTRDSSGSRRAGPRLEAHALSLACSPPAAPVDAAAVTPTKVESTPSVIRRHLKTIAEGFDSLAAAAKNTSSSRTSGVRSTGMKKSRSEPEALDRLDNSDVSTDDGIESTAGFDIWSSGGYQTKAVRLQHQDDLGDSPVTGRVEQFRRHGSSSGFHVVSSVVAGRPRRSSDADQNDRTPQFGSSTASSRQTRSTSSLKLWLKDLAAVGVKSDARQKPDVNGRLMSNGRSDHQHSGPSTPVRATIRRRSPAPSTLLQLTEVERLALQKIALARLQHSEHINCPVAIPKGWSGGSSSGTRAMQRLIRLKRYVSSVGTAESVLRDPHRTSPAANGNPSVANKSWVFGIPLGKCIANEADLSQQSSSVAPPAECSLIDALSLSCDRPTLKSAMHDNSDGKTLQVPYIVRICCKHLQTHGLSVPGIFRIAGSKSRIAMLRQEFDSGRFVQLTSDHGVHDVASLLKEYLRDLPDPLLTRTLHTAFLAAAGIDDVNSRVSILRLLVALLPPPNRDTLCTLLTFLGTIARHSDDIPDQDGQLISGNKMDSSNLATVFGPNVLRRTKNNVSRSQLMSLEEMAQNADIVSVTKDLIDFHAAIFRLKSDLYDEIIASPIDKAFAPADVQLMNGSVASEPPTLDQSNGFHPPLYIDTTDGSEGSFRTCSSGGCDHSSSPSSSTDPSRPNFDQSQSTEQLNLPHSTERLNGLANGLVVDCATSARTLRMGGSMNPQDRNNYRSPDHRSSDKIWTTTDTRSDLVDVRPESDWAEQRWRHWEQQTRRTAAETNEQQTLV